MRITIEIDDCKDAPAEQQPPSQSQPDQVAAVDIGPAPAAPDATPAMPSTDQRYESAYAPDHPAGAAPNP
ncbi:hypothetical protein [Kitasatospora arboriphila]|uniref:Uncharacterized protein n=1 Tax=Kitasatospora arboriphila TaxID=258052 RepID=A0ABP4EHG7_9ACTN